MAKKTAKRKSAAKRATEAASNGMKACEHIEKAFDELSRARVYLKKIGAKKADKYAADAQKKMDVLVRACYG